jgi:CubicO group peptidase (beta-lactamase class C family)
LAISIGTILYFLKQSKPFFDTSCSFLLPFFLLEIPALLLAFNFNTNKTMTARLHISLFILLSAITVFGQVKPQAFATNMQAEYVGISAERLKRLDAHLNQWIEKGLAPNAVTFIARRGVVIHHKAFGFSHLEKKTPLKRDDIFRIASQSKAITSVALMTLYEEGRFLLDDPIHQYIPAFKNTRVLERYDKETGQYITRPPKSPITIRHLLTHTAGIPYEHPLDRLPAFQVPFFCSDQKDILADVVDKIAARPLTADPGEKYIYGLNSDVIGRLVEILSGEPLDVALRKRVLDPLSMTDTYFYLPDNKAARLVELYSKETRQSTLTVHKNDVYRQFAVRGAKSYFSGGAGLVSTIEDYAKFCQMMLNGGMFNNKRILTRKTIELMTRNHIGDLEVWDRGDKFGLGFQIFTPQSKYAGLASPNAYTWGGMYCSEYTIDPKEDLILLIFTNAHPYEPYGDFVKIFRNLVYQALED